MTFIISGSFIMFSIMLPKPFFSGAAPESGGGRRGAAAGAGRAEDCVVWATKLRSDRPSFHPALQVLIVTCCCWLVARPNGSGFAARSIPFSGFSNLVPLQRKGGGRGDANGEIKFCAGHKFDWTMPASIGRQLISFAN